MKVLVNIICKNYNKDELIKLTERCRSQNHKVTVNICDYTLEKKVDTELGEIVSEDFNQHILSLNFEDLSTHDQNLVEFMRGESYDAVIDMDSSIDMEPNFLDIMGLETLEDNNYGSVYTDFYSKTKNGHKIYIHQKSFPLVNNSVPLVAFSVDAYMKNLGNDNPKGRILSSMVSKHIKKAVCSINNA